LTALRTNIVITAMGEHDLLEVVHLEEQSGLSRWGWDAYYQELKAPVGPIMRVARVSEKQASGQVVGFVAARVTGNELHINNIAVSDEFRGQGIGGALMDIVLGDAASKLGATRAFLEVRRSNVAARALYQSRGFREVGVRKNYYHSPTEDAIIMGLEYIRKA
jgi:[ribosomal protein S18]-alanine N-acetyltransferase